MALKVYNQKGELLVTTPDLETLEMEAADAKDLLREILLEVRLARVILADAFKCDIRPDDVEETL